jgi:hypothetical protein
MAILLECKIVRFGGNEKKRALQQPFHNTKSAADVTVGDTNIETIYDAQRITSITITSDEIVLGFFDISHFSTFFNLSITLW